jgi:hypothetical protein
MTLPDGPTKHSSSRMMMTLVFALAGRLTYFLREKISKQQKARPASLSSADRRRSPARGTAQAVAAELAYRLKQSSLSSA